MSLTLSSADCAQLQKALEVITAPLDAPSMAEWRQGVLAVLAPVFHADAASFVLAGDGEPACSLLNRPPGFVEDYVKVQDLDVTREIMASSERVTCTEELSAGNRRAFTHSDIYHAFYRPHGIEDALFTTFGEAERPPVVGPGQMFIPGGVVVQGMIVFYAEQTGRERIAGAGLPLLRMLKPALKAAAVAWQQLGARRAEFQRLVDSSGDAIMVHDGTGALLHRNPAAATLATVDSAFSRVEVAGREMARVLNRAVARGTFDAMPPLVAEVDTAAQRYTLRATRAAALFGRDGAVIISVQPQRSVLPSRASIQRCGLTSREAEVAQLLAIGKSNNEVAAALSISIFTARRHTERVLAKLGVDSRSMVAAKLVGLTE